MPLFGAAVGAASGALGGALTDYGINDPFMKDLAASIQPGNAALFVLIRRMTADKVLEDLRGSGGVVLKTSLDHSKEQALRDALTAAQASTPAPTPSQPTPGQAPSGQAPSGQTTFGQGTSGQGTAGDPNDRLDL
jgi:hypothetical protein